jgi:alkylhydroperoxidase/carboxymuconolactone decarboxylase family protein YurZ
VLAVAAGTRRQDRIASMRRHARALAERGYSAETLETMLFYGGFPEAREKIWQPLIARELKGAAERARRREETERSVHEG